MKPYTKYKENLKSNISIYDLPVLGFSSADAVETKYDTEYSIGIVDTTPTSKYERARKVNEDVGARVQFTNTRWDSSDPAYAFNLINIKDDIEELAECMDNGNIINSVNDPDSLGEIANVLYCNKTSAGECDYSSRLEEQRLYQQKSKFDNQNQAEFKSMRKTGFF